MITRTTNVTLEIKILRLNRCTLNHVHTHHFIYIVIALFAASFIGPWSIHDRQFCCGKSSSDGHLARRKAASVPFLCGTGRVAVVDGCSKQYRERPTESFDDKVSAGLCFQCIFVAVPMHEAMAWQCCGLPGNWAHLYKS